MSTSLGPLGKPPKVYLLMNNENYLHQLIASVIALSIVKALIIHGTHNVLNMLCNNKNLKHCYDVVNILSIN